MKTSVPQLRAGLAPLVCLLVSVCLFTSGCTTMQNVAVPGAHPAAGVSSATVHVGEEVEVHTRDAQMYTFKVTAIEDDALVGAKIRVKYADMIDLRARKISKGYTALSVGVIAYTILVVGILVALSHLGPGMTGG